MLGIVIVSSSVEHNFNIKNSITNPWIKRIIFRESSLKISIEGGIVRSSCIIIVSIAIKKDNAKIADIKQRDKNHKIHKPILTKLTITTQVHRSNAKLPG